jgi:four helix bundle protein
MKSRELEKKIQLFVLDVLRVLHKRSKNEENTIFIKQLIRSVSSIGANYAEAIFAHTKQDFLHIMNICRKEANETVYWLMLLKETNTSFQNEIETRIDEGTQILRIFISSVRTAKENLNGQ